MPRSESGYPTFKARTLKDIALATGVRIPAGSDVEVEGFCAGVYARVAPCMRGKLWPHDVLSAYFELETSGRLGSSSSEEPEYLVCDQLTLEDILEAWPEIKGMPLTPAQCAGLERVINRHGPVKVQGITYAYMDDYVGVTYPWLFIGIEKSGEAHT